MIQTLLRRISRTAYVRSAMADGADLALFKKRPTPRLFWGLIVIGISYTIGWPAVVALGIIAGYLQEPLVLIIGGPVTYGLSHLVFIVGAYLAGGQYAYAFLRWATRVTMEKLLTSSEG
jgi:hypothetical protein